MKNKMNHIKTFENIINATTSVDPTKSADFSISDDNNINRIKKMICDDIESCKDKEKIENLYRYILENEIF